MRPTDVQPIGNELAIKWSDGTETFIRFDTLRRACPCAGCQGETDILGQLHKAPTVKLTAKAFELSRLRPVGTYAIQPVWGDGHASGIYSFEYLSRIAAKANL